ncbi:hypothetical protein HK100_004169 [Physocladia obscura]|uniref:Uncharacterized protein n=1 Tax=Physocladia obscura TaxID=109957 RepID=A0AAD5SVD5_9FUNG|nr:hypothetical protein HK100_004169 [Physocladia obscura]
MDANYLKHAIGAPLTSAISSLLAHPHPTAVQDPVNHIATHLLHQDATATSESVYLRHHMLIDAIVNKEKTHIKNLSDCKKKIGAELPDAIARMEIRGAERVRRQDEAERRRAEDERREKELAAASFAENVATEITANASFALENMTTGGTVIAENTEEEN